VSRDRAGTEGRLLKLTFIGSFLGATAVASGRRPVLPTPTELVMLGLASHRIGRMVAFERVGEPLRAPFTATVPDDSGADEAVVARGRGVRWVVGELVSCPTCVATWASLALAIGQRFLPGPTRVLVGILAVAGVAEVVNGVSEQLEWSARAARVSAAPDADRDVEEPGRYSTPTT
jgi:hypothetical protein